METRSMLFVWIHRRMDNSRQVLMTKLSWFGTPTVNVSKLWQAIQMESGTLATSQMVRDSSLLPVIAHAEFGISTQESVHRLLRNTRAERTVQPWITMHRRLQHAVVIRCSVFGMQKNWTSLSLPTRRVPRALWSVTSLMIRSLCILVL